MKRALRSARSGAISALTSIRAVLVATALVPLRIYSKLISPGLPARCKYHPTCSAYAEQAVLELGLVRGGIVAAWRLARCNPWSDGGFDPLDARRLFRPGDGASRPEPHDVERDPGDAQPSQGTPEALA